MTSKGPDASVVDKFIVRRQPAIAAAGAAGTNVHPLTVGLLHGAHDEATYRLSINQLCTICETF